MKNNILMFLIILSYLKPLLLIIKKFNHNNSLSSIICHLDYKQFIIDYMSILSFFIILYEINRGNFYSLIIMLFFIYNSINMIKYKHNDSNHYKYALGTFISLYLFMILHCYKLEFLKILLIIEIIFAFIVFYNLYNNYSIIEIESLILFCFGIYFLILHFI